MHKRTIGEKIAETERRATRIAGGKGPSRPYKTARKKFLRNLLNRARTQKSISKYRIKRAIEKLARQK